MSIRYPLDTNIVSDLVRNPQGSAATKIAEVGEGTVCVDPVIAREIRFGLSKRNSSSLTSQAERILNALPILPIESPIEDHYASIRWTLETAGIQTGPNDLWIAAHACSRDLILVTADLSEFSRVPGLSVENWLE